MARAPLLALLLLAAAASVSAGRELLQTGNPTCPYACDTAGGGCVRDTTTGGYRCIKCQSGWTVIRSSGRCGCPRGQKGSVSGCTNCLAASDEYCPGGEASSTSTPASVGCGTGATTLGDRAVSKEQCVNKPGYSWNGVAGTATECLADTYSTGLKKQPSCTPCPPGMNTDNAARSTSASACVVPAGYYLKAPGQVAACPQGEYKSGTGMATSCTKCPDGVTTAGPASTDATACTQLLAGWFATAATGSQVTAAQLCTQDSYCPGDLAQGTNGKVTCPNARYTKTFGASNVADCMVPPGWGVETAGTDMAECGPGYYRENWAYVDSASGTAPCVTCSGLAAVNGFLSSATDPIARFNSSNVAITSVLVKGSKTSCYIQRGQAVYQSAAGFRVVTCSSDNYGVTGTTYGVSAMPCRDCPTGMSTVGGNALSDLYLDGTTNGYYDGRACVTDAGYGYNGRVATKCQIGYWSAGGGNTTCTACDYGYTTVAEGSDAAADCVMAAGFGSYSGVVRTCPTGSYHTVNQTGACDTCGTGLTTQGEGSDAASDCNVCSPGYGETDCATACPSGKYSTGGGAIGTACDTCPSMTGGGFVFTWANATNAYTPAAVSLTGSTTVGDCLAAFSQVVDDVGYINTTEAGAATTQNTLDLCLAECTGACMYATYDYSVGSNNCRVYSADAAGGTKVVGFKAVPSGNVVASASKAAALASGRYTFWLKDVAVFDDAATVVGVTTADGCMESCDADANCVAVAWDTSASPLVCKNIAADTTVGTGKRSLAVTKTGQLTAATAGSA